MARRRSTESLELGIVDLDAEIGLQVESMDRACCELGFFRLPIDTVTAHVRDAAWSTALQFFALDDEAKAAIAFPEPGYPYGYSPFRAETLARSLDDCDAEPDLKESLSVGPDCGGARTPLPGEEWICSSSLWPDEVPELRQAWVAYYRELSDVAERLLCVMALALGLPESYFEPFVDRPITSMRAIHYPIAPASATALRAGAHTDYGTFTILRTDDVPGLEVQDRVGRWRAIEPDPDCFVVNLGDTIAQWTNDRWRSTLHRVVPGAAERHSFAFFHMANWDARIECLPTCLDPGSVPNHEPIEAGPWLMRKFQSTV